MTNHRQQAFNKIFTCHFSLAVNHSPVEDRRPAHMSELGDRHYDRVSPELPYPIHMKEKTPSLGKSCFCHSGCGLASSSSDMHCLHQAFFSPAEPCYNSAMTADAAWNINASQSMPVTCYSTSADSSTTGKIRLYVCAVKIPYIQNCLT